MRKMNGKDTSRTKAAEKVVKNCCTLYRNSLPLKKMNSHFQMKQKIQGKSRKQSGKCASGSKSNKSQTEDLKALTR